MLCHVKLVCGFNKVTHPQGIGKQFPFFARRQSIPNYNVLPDLKKTRHKGSLYYREKKKSGFLRK